MKTYIITPLFFFFFISGFSQNSNYEYSGRFNPSVKKEKLNEISFIGEITPDLWPKMVLYYKDWEELDQRKRADFSQGLSLPGHYNYMQLIEYVSVEIEVTGNGKMMTSQSTSDRLTTEQKSIMNLADLGSDLIIKVKFRYKDHASGKADRDGRIIEGQLAVAVVPETEAAYPGGFKQLSEYLRKNVMDKISGTTAFEKLRQSIVKFTINEEGQIEGTQIFMTSTDPKIDRLLLDAFSKMPRWIPAQNSKGIRVKQEFNFPFGSDGC